VYIYRSYRKVKTGVSLFLDHPVGYMQLSGTVHNDCYDCNALCLQLSGMVLLLGAIYVRMDSHLNHVITAAYSDHLHVFQSLCYVVIAAGAVITFVGFLGCCSAYQESCCMLTAVSLGLSLTLLVLN